MVNKHWQTKRKEYKSSDWSAQPSIFVQFVNDYLPNKGKILELGAGIGQDTRYFADKGYEVVSTDFIIEDNEPHFPNNVIRE